jgi:hypothetical protein
MIDPMLGEAPTAAGGVATRHAWLRGDSMPDYVTLSRDGLMLIEAKSWRSPHLGRNESGMSSIAEGLRLIFETERMADAFRLLCQSQDAAKAHPAFSLSHELAHYLLREESGHDHTESVAPPRAVTPWLRSCVEPPSVETPPTELATVASRALHPLIAAPAYARDLAQRPDIWPPDLAPVFSQISDVAAPEIRREPTRLSRAVLARLDYLAGRLRGHSRAGARHWRQIHLSYFSRAFACIGRADRVLPSAPHEPCDLLPLRGALTPTAPPTLAV